MYWLNKIAWMALNPALPGIVILTIAVVLLIRNRKRAGLISAVLGTLWFYAWSISATDMLLCIPLERDYANLAGYGTCENFPEVDAIVDLGGAMTFNTNKFPYVQGPAGRAWQCARLWKAGRAPIVIPTGKGIAETDAVLLRDLGVPEFAIKVENFARNTEEHPKYLMEMLGASETNKVKVIVVTSAWHLKRAMMMFEKYGPYIEAIPCPGEVDVYGDAKWGWARFMPTAAIFEANVRHFHEWVGIFWYTWFR